MQGIKDLITKIKEDKRLLSLIIGGIIFGSAFLLILPSTNQKSKQQAYKNQDSTSFRSSQGDQVYKDLLERFSSDLERLSEVTQKTQQELETQKQLLAEHQERTKEIFTKLVEKMAEKQSYPQQAASLEGDLRGKMSSGEMLKLEMQKFMDSAPAIPVVAPAKPRRSAVINAGDAVRVELLSGVNAPVEGSPYPVVFKVVGDVVGPNNTTLPVGEARILAAAQGSLIDQRVLFRLTSMTLSLPDGSRKEVKIDGWVVGEDGIRGLPGILIDPLSERLLGAGIAEGVRGLGQGIEASRRKTKVDHFLGLSFEDFRGSPLELGTAKALQGVAGVYSDAIKQRAELLTPVVQVFSGRQATAVFSRSVELGEDLLLALEEDYDSFGGLYE